MKFLKEKLAFTLMELIIGMTISSILFFIIFSFIADGLDELQNSNARTTLINQVFSLRDNLNKFIKGGYFYMSEIGNSEFGVLLLKDTYSTDGIVFGVIDKDTMKLKKDYLYGNNFIGYRRLSETEINNIELDNNEVYNLTFFQDKLYNGINVKDFDVEFYNSGTILDLKLGALYILNTSYVGESFTGVVIEDSEFIEFNLNF